METKECRVMLTKKCNFKCPYCINEHPGVFDLFKPATINDVDWSKYDSVKLTGGEPFTLPKDVLKRIILSLKARGVKKIYVYTNGKVLLDLESSYPGSAMALIRDLDIDGLSIGVHEDVLNYRDYAVLFNALRSLGESLRFISIEQFSSTSLKSFFALHKANVRYVPLDEDCSTPNEDKFMLKYA